MYCNTNYRGYVRCVSDLLHTKEVQSMRTIPHHPRTNCYEHSVHVSYVAFRLARRFGLDYRTVARAGLMHDLYLYNAKIKGSHEGHQCFAHPKAAVANAEKLCGPLTDIEKNSILSHMWPLSPYRPRSKEAFVVNLADKICATTEFFQIFHWLRYRHYKK